MADPSKYFKVVKIGRSRANVIDIATGEMLCQLPTARLNSWLYGATKARDDEARYAAEGAANFADRFANLPPARRARIMSYLSAREERRTQLSFNF